MRLPSPREQLAGCVWLARIVAKARLLGAGQLPADYQARFGHASGVDGQFLRFFNLRREDIVAVCGGTDAEVVAWFTALPSATSERISEWNHLAVNLGRSGFPMAERLPIVLATTYKHLAGQTFETVFAILEADENLA